MLRICLLVSIGTMTGIAQQTASNIQQRIQKTKERLGDRLLKTADEIIAGHVEAVGGREALLSVNTLRFSGRFLRFGVDERILYRHYQQPDLIRSSWSPEGDTYTLSDGEKVWSVSPEGRKEQDAPWAVSFSHIRIDGNFIEYTKRGIVYEYIGLEGFDSEPFVYYHLRRTFPDGLVEELYFDIDSGFLHGVWRTVAPGEYNRTYYYDYRRVGSIRIPHIWVAVMERGNPPHVLVVDEAAIDEDFGEGFFTEYLNRPVQE